MHKDDGFCMETCCMPYPKSYRDKPLSTEEIERINVELMQNYIEELERGEGADAQS